MECFCAVVDALVLLVTGHNCMTRSSALNYTGEDIERRPRTMEANRRRARSYGNYQRTSSGTVPLSSCRRRYFSNSQFATRRKKNSQRAPQDNRQTAQSIFTAPTVNRAVKRSKRFLFSKFQWLVNATGWKIENQNKHFSNICYNQTTNP